MKNSFITVMIIVMTVMSGCSIKEVEKPITMYAVTDTAVKHHVSYHTGKILKVERFKSPKYLKNSGIWYKKDTNEMNSYVYASWSEDFPDMLQNELTGALFKSGLFKSVYTKYSKIKSDYILEGEIENAVQIVSEKESYIEFSIRLYFIDRINLAFVDSKNFVYREKCDTIDSKGAVKAYNRIIKKLDKDVVLWLKRLVKES